jgi:hypothetical protein
MIFEPISGGISLENTAGTGLRQWESYGFDVMERRGCRVMRRQLVSLALAALVLMATAVFAAPALDDDGAAVAGAPPVAVQRVSLALPALRDEAAMVLVGTVLIGLAAAVRRAA